ncbi:MAG TPA: hypothetical protein VH063_02055 [Gaiellaceae bacterium]|jgi:hypothetical protein|nr:hypothetical protein [Gaiellaceae bacterium]
MPNYYVAIDDTDRAEDDGRGQGTGAKSRAFARELLEAVDGRQLGITRHQLLIDPAVPYTSHNSSACIVVESGVERGWVIETMVEIGRLYLPEIASPGADVGLCVAEESQIGDAVVEWGRRAKVEVVTMDEAHEIAGEAGIRLEGLTGDKVGVIGALAAVGLRRSGRDGRFLELGELRRAIGEQPAAVFMDAGVQRFVSGEDDVELAPDELISVGHKHAQPVLLDGQPTLLLDPSSRRGGWRAAPRESVKSY